MFVAHNKSIVNLKFVAAVEATDNSISFLGNPVTFGEDPLPLIERWYFDTEDEWRTVIAKLEEVMDIHHC